MIKKALFLVLCLSWLQQAFAADDRDVDGSSAQSGATSGSAPLSGAASKVIPSANFKFAAPEGGVISEIHGESEHLFARSVRDSAADLDLLTPVVGGAKIAGNLVKRSVARRVDDNPYAALLFFRKSNGVFLGCMAQGVQPAFGFAVGFGYKPDEHAGIIQSFVNAGVRTPSHEAVIDAATGKPLGLLSIYCYLNPDRAVTYGEEVLAIFESMYQLAVFERAGKFLLPAENDPSLAKQHRAVPHQMYMITDRGDWLDKLLQGFDTGYVRHAEAGLNQFYPPKESVVYTRIIPAPAV